MCEEPAVNDYDAGAMMLLLPRTADWNLDSGCVGSRIVWVSLQGMFQMLFVVGWYVPHKYRAKPDQMNTFKQIRSIIETKARRGDVVIGIGDAKYRLKRSVKRYMGRYCAHPSDDSGGAMLHELMVYHKLLAARTYFKPPRRAKHGSATYLQKDSEYGALQIGYALVSRRWLSSVQNCAVKWAPSIHIFGYKQAQCFGTVVQAVRA